MTYNVFGGMLNLAQCNPQNANFVVQLISVFLAGGHVQFMLTTGCELTGGGGWAGLVPPCCFC